MHVTILRVAHCIEHKAKIIFQEENPVGKSYQT